MHVKLDESVPIDISVYLCIYMFIIYTTVYTYIYIVTITVLSRFPLRADTNRH